MLIRELVGKESGIWWEDGFFLLNWATTEAINMKLVEKGGSICTHKQFNL